MLCAFGCGGAGIWLDTPIRKYITIHRFDVMTPLLHGALLLASELFGTELTIDALAGFSAGTLVVNRCCADLDVVARLAPNPWRARQLAVVLAR